MQDKGDLFLVQELIKDECLPNGENIKVVRIREVEIMLHNGQIVTLGKVRYVPNL